MSLPINIAQKSITISYNDSSNVLINKIITNDFFQITFNFTWPGYYEIKATENHFNTFSSKMINLLDGNFNFNFFKNFQISLNILF